MDRKSFVWASLAVVVPLACSGGAGKQDQPGTTARRVERVLSSLRPTTEIVGEPRLGQPLAQRMVHHNVPGVSIALVDSGRIVWARGYGVKQTGTSDSITTETLFQAASISKPVASIGTMILVQQGRVALDEDVNEKLVSWKVPSNAFTAKERVTLRRIMSHSAGLTVHGFPGYAAGDSVPTVPEILDGKKPANTAPVRVDVLPGSMFRYSGGGMTIMQLLVTDLTREPYAAFLKQNVLDPLGMSHSTYEQPLPPGRSAEAAIAYRRDGTAIPGKWHTYPEQAAAGLWTTPSDLARMIIAVSNAYTGRASSPLSKEIVSQMLTLTKPTTYGLGFGLEGSGDSLSFAHGGSNEGYRCLFVGFPTRGQGIALMTNSDNGSAVISEIVAAFAQEFGWPGQYITKVTPAPITPTQRERFVGVYRAAGGDLTLTITTSGDTLFVDAPVVFPKQRYVATSDTTLAGAEGGPQLVFVMDRKSSGPAREVFSPGTPLRAKRMP